jgi:hypothetical protein
VTQGYERILKPVSLLLPEAWRRDEHDLVHEDAASRTWSDKTSDNDVPYLHALACDSAGKSWHALALACAVSYEFFVIRAILDESPSGGVVRPESPRHSPSLALVYDMRTGDIGRRILPCHFLTARLVARGIEARSARVFCLIS